jgi:cysteine desulfurase/selenocysteine lyase
MNEITPELIAAIATRLYNEIPGANQVPKTETDMPPAVPETAELPFGVPEVPVTTPISSAPGLAGAGLPGAVGFISDGHGIPGNSGYNPTLPEVPGDDPVPPDGFSEPGEARIYSQAYTIPNLKGLTPEGASLPGLSGITPAWPGVPSNAGTTPEISEAPVAAAIVSQGYSVSIPTGFTPDGANLPGVATDLPATFGVPNPKGIAPDGVGVPGAATDFPATFGVPNPKGVAPDGVGVPGAATDLPATFGVPNPKGVAPEGASVPGPGGISPSGPGSPNTAGLVPDGLNVPGIPSHTLEGLNVTSSADVSPASFTLPGSAATSTDGLNAFVQQIRSTHIRDENGQCVAGREQDLIRRLVAGNAVPKTGARPLDVPTIRKDFPILNQKVHGKPLAWLDNAATTQKPQSVIDTLSYFYAHDNSNIHRGAHTLAARATDAFEQARQKVQGFLGASSAKEIIYVRGTTEGVNLVAQTYGRKFLRPGDEIILSTLEHHANIVPWQMIAHEKGAVIRVIPVNDQGEVMLEAYEALLGPRTRLVALTHASNSLGTILPVAEMTHAAKRYGARVLIDGAQSVSHMPVNVQQIGCDFFVFSGHKIFAPTGIGVVYIKEELLEILPPWQGGGNMIKNVTFEETTYNDAPAKFEAGTPNIADAVGLGAALDYVNRLGLVNTGKYEHELLQYATEQLSRINGLRMIGSAPEKVAVISFVLRERKTEEVGRLLDLEGIAVRAGHHCAQPSLRRFGVEATVRPSFAFYNTFDEIDRLADAVKHILRV